MCGAWQARTGAPPERAKGTLLTLGRAWTAVQLSTFAWKGLARSVLVRIDAPTFNAACRSQFASPGLHPVDVSTACIAPG